MNIDENFAEHERTHRQSHQTHPARGDMGVVHSIPQRLHEPFARVVSGVGRDRSSRGLLGRDRWARRVPICPPVSVSVRQRRLEEKLGAIVRQTASEEIQDEHVLVLPEPMIA